MKKNIYSHESQEVIKRFSKLSPAEYMIVPVDYAGREHTVQFCLGTGELLMNKALYVYNNKAGNEFLRTKINKVCRKAHIKKQNVIIAVEDPPDFIRNFIHELKYNGFTCVRVNPKDAAKHRSSTRASSDKIDLNGIAQSVINKKFYEIKEDSELYFILRRSSRNRRRLIKERTTLKNRIRRYADILFPGFLDVGNTSLRPYTKGCLTLMEEEFSVFKINRMRLSSLSKTLKKNGTPQPETTAEKIKKFADKIIPPSEKEISYLSRSLGYAVRTYRALDEWICTEENIMAEYLVQSPYFYLTSIPGVAVILAAYIAGEIGEPSKWKYPDRIASYGGIEAKEKQTGGSGKKAVQLCLPRNSNRRLKDCLIQVGLNMGKFTHPAGKYIERLGRHKLYEDFWKAENRGSKSALCTGKKFLKIGAKLILENRIYLPQHFLGCNVLITREENVIWHNTTAELLKKKWSLYDLSNVPEEKNLLKKEIAAIEEYNKFVQNRTDDDG